MAAGSAGNLTSEIVNVATALSQQRLKSQQSIAVLDKALDAQAQTALSLIETVTTSSPSQGGVGSLVDLVA